MKKRFLSKLGLATLVAAASILGTNQTQVSAAPMKDVQVKLTQPDGQAIECYASGDEFYNYLHDSDGRAIVKDSSTGYYVYGKYVKDEVQPSRERVTNEQTEALKNVNNDSRVNISEVNVPTEEIEKQREEFSQSISNYSTKNIGKLNNIVIFISFQDQQNQMSRSAATYTRDFNSQTQASLNNYYKESSYNQLDISTTFYPKSQGDTVLTYKDSHPRSYYSNVPQNERAMREQTLLKNAVDSVKSQIPKDLNVDLDNDGKVDNVCFVVKGGTDGWSSLLWPHMWVMYAQNAEINGKRVNTYNFQLEDFFGNNSVGVLSHEMFHTLGAPDLYHYDSSNRITAVGPWDVMDQNYSIPQSMGTYMKMYYGKWINSINEISKPGKYSIKSITNSSNNSYIIKSPKSASEYFVVEYRKKQGIYESGLPGEGLVVYRINKNYQGKGNASSKYTSQDEVYIYRPNGGVNSVGNLSNAALGGNKTSISSSELFLSNGADSGISLQNISLSGDTASFNVVINGETGDGGSEETAYLGKNFNFNFKGYSDKQFAKLDVDLNNLNSKLTVENIMPHYYFSDSYASLLIRDAGGNTVYTKDFIGNKTNEALVENIVIKPGYYITINHREADNRLFITNTSNNLQLEKGKSITYKITNTGLVKSSEGEMEELPLKYAVNFDDSKTITGDIEIAGECVSGKKVTNVEIDINGAKFMDAQRSVLSDTQNKYPGYDLSQGAFKFKLNCSAWTDSNYSYKIVATTENGQKTTLKEGTLKVKKETGGTGGDEVKAWQSGIDYKVGDVVTYNGYKYKCLQAHKSMISWNPVAAFSLWSRIYN